MGNLTRDPELRYLPSGQPVTSFSIAMNRVYNSQTGEKKEEVSYVRVVVWARLAEICNEYLKKGSPVFVEGRMQSRSWEGQDGTKRSTIEVVAPGQRQRPAGRNRPRRNRATRPCGSDSRCPSATRLPASDLEGTAELARISGRETHCRHPMQLISRIARLRSGPALLAIHSRKKLSAPTPGGRITPLENPCRRWSAWFGN